MVKVNHKAINVGNIVHNHTYRICEIIESDSLKLDQLITLELTGIALRVVTQMNEFDSKENNDTIISSISSKGYVGLKEVFDDNGIIVTNAEVFKLIIRGLIMEAKSLFNKAYNASVKESLIPNVELEGDTFIVKDGEWYLSTHQENAMSSFNVINRLDRLLGEKIRGAKECIG